MFSVFYKSLGRISTYMYGTRGRELMAVYSASVGLGVRGECSVV